jgi:TRAP-type C4-dicarboxylate transport system substrate-binding protein
MKKGLIIIVGLVLASLFGCAETQPGKQITIKLSHQYDTTHIQAKSAVEFAKLVEERTKGQVKFEIYPGSQLYDAKKGNEAVSAGVIEMTSTFDSPLSSWVPDWAASTYPLIHHPKQTPLPFYDYLFTTDVGKKLLTETEAKGLKVLSYFDCGGAFLITKKQVAKVEDIAKLKIRVTVGVAEKALFDSIGGSSIVIPMGEVYMALQTGTIDGNLTTAGGWVGQMQHEIARYREEHVIQATAGTLVINTQFWNSLPPDIQKILKQAADDAAKWHNSGVVADSKEKWEIAKKAGAVFYSLPDSEIAKWRDLAIARYDDARKQIKISDTMWDLITKYKK